MKQSPWNTLPLEVCCIIFEQIESVTELANCRLVCKMWNPLAEKAMFGQHLEFRRAESIVKFIAILKSKPAATRFIKSISLFDPYHKFLQLQKELLDLALTPNIRYLRGEMSEELFGHLLCIAQQSPSKFDRLQALPKLNTIASGKFSEMGRCISSIMGTGKLNTMRSKYFDAMLYFKKPLKELNASLSLFEVPGLCDCIFNHLDEFTSLTKLALDFYGFPNYDMQSRYFLELEMILNQCGTLQTLKLDLLGWGVSHSMEKVEFKEWLSNNVVPVPSLHTIILDRASSPHMLEYVVHKYPKVSKIIIENFNTCTERVLDAIKNIDTVQLLTKQTIIEGSFLELFRKMRSKTNQMQILGTDDPNKGGPLLDITKCKSTGITKFVINTMSAPQLIYEEIISLIGSVNCLETRYIGYCCERERGKPLLDKLRDVVPFDSLDKLACFKLQCDGEEINANICEKLASAAPNLNHLTINASCSYEKGHHVYFPRADLETVSIFRTPGSTKKYLQEAQEVLLIIEKTGAPQMSYYLLTPGANGLPSRSQQISKQSLSEYPHKLPVIRIAFKSLSNLKISLGALLLEMKFDPEARTEQSIVDC
ncbi:hypothetical protein BD408DRAFT_434058 [Parasitella parasitica]|nr:hypothetical protein BD408DRAFT_434058 [Parasitella parasitica]